MFIILGSSAKKRNITVDFMAIIGSIAFHYSFLCEFFHLPCLYFERFPSCLSIKVQINSVVKVEYVVGLMVRI